MPRILIHILVLFVTATNAQINDSTYALLSSAEADIGALQDKTFRSKKETERAEGNRQFIAAWDKIITRPEILRYSFTRLKDVSILQTADKNLMLITWNLHRDDGTHAYFGYLLVKRVKKIKKGFLRSEKVESYDYHKLLDRSATVKYPETYLGTPDKWYGMLYTQLIECDGYLTLIGWDGNNKLTQKKFVDVLHFRGDGTPVFGKDVFKFPRKNPRRLMFEYSSEVTMSVRYLEKRNMIVYNHLSANKEGLLEGQFQFYGPDGRYDALIMKKDKWVTMEDIDARNEENEKDDDWNNPRKPSKKKTKKFLPGSAPN